jgi:hypothetical protein
MADPGKYGSWSWGTPLTPGTWTRSWKRKSNMQNYANCLPQKGMDVILLPIVLGSAGTLFKYLDRATKEMDIPNARKKKLYSKLHLHSIHSLQNLVSQRRYLERQKPTAEARGRIRRR